MALTVFDARISGLRPLVPAAPPALSWRCGPAPRERAAGEAFARAALFLGLAPARRETGPCDLAVGGEDPGAGAAWLAVGPETGGGGEAGALAFLRFKTHYRAPLTVDARALSQAAAERARLLSAAAGLSEASSAASPRAVAAYLYRFREALSRDFDAPEALACVWDALRPGALSPGSRAALLRETLPVIGLP